MNKTVVIAALAIAACGLSSTVRAAPMMAYNPVNGSIYFQNDHTGPLANISVISSSGSLRSKLFLRDIPGAIKDDSELPFAFTYLNLPVGITFAGFIVQPGTPINSVEYQYRLNSLTEPLKPGVVPTLDWVPFPEPASCTMAIMSAVALVGTARRGRGWRGGV